jgi:hypothetical protein
MSPPVPTSVHSDRDDRDGENCLADFCCPPSSRYSVCPNLRVFEVIETICCQEDTGGPQPFVQTQKLGSCE